MKSLSVYRVQVFVRLLEHRSSKQFWVNSQLQNRKSGAYVDVEEPLQLAKCKKCGKIAVEARGTHQ